jgi:hypothetical protein
MRRDALVAGVLVLLVAPLLFLGGAYLISSGLLGVVGPAPEPPKAVIYHEGRKIEPAWSTIGCWREKRRLLPDKEACISSESGVPGEEGLPPGTLRVERGDTLSFESGRRSDPERVSASAVRVDVPFDEELASEQDRKRDYQQQGAYYSPLGYRAQEVPVRMEGSRAEVDADLPPGEYVITFSIRVDDAEAAGEAFYDFEVIVEP